MINVSYSSVNVLSLKDLAAGESRSLHNKYVKYSLYSILVVIEGPLNAYYLIIFYINTNFMCIINYI